MLYRPLSILLLIALLALVMPVPTVAQVFEGHWSDAYFVSGTSTPPQVIIEHEGQFVFGGNFQQAGNLPYRHVVRSTGASWIPFATGIPDAVVAMVRHEGELIALTSGTRRLWRLDGDDWVALSEPLGGEATVMASYAGDLYVGGSVWNGAELIDFLQADGPVNALAVHQGVLAIGGSFTACGSDTLGTLVAWDGTQITRPWPELGQHVRHLSAHEDQLVAIGGIPGWQAEYLVYRFAGEEWQLLPFPAVVPEYRVARFTLWHEGQLYAAYAYHGWNWHHAYFRRWTGSQWVEIAGSGTILTAAASTSSGLVLAGDGLRHGNTFYGTVARRPNSDGEGHLMQIGPVGLGLTGGGVRDMRLDHWNGQIVGGGFTAFGNRISPGVIVNFGGSWSPLPMDPSVLPQYATVATALYHPYYGAYASVEDYSLNQYRWLHGSYGWEFHPDVMHEPYGASQWAVYQIHGGTVVGTVAGGQIKDLHYWQDSLIAGGSFSSISGTPASRIARRVGSQWQAFPAAIGGSVAVITDWNGQLVIAGQRIDPDGPNHWQVAIWTGAAWHPLGGSFNFDIHALAAHEDHLYAGGIFTSVGGFPIRRLAGWDGQAWRPVGDGCSGGVHSLLSHQGKLWIGGDFLEAGGHNASYLTTWTFHGVTTDAPLHREAVVALRAPHPNPFNPTTTVSFTLPRAADLDLAVFDLRGRRLQTLVAGHRSRGTHHAQWHGTDDRGRTLASGVYLVRLQVDREVATRRVSLIR